MKKKSKIIMAILQRGWIFVGRMEKEGNHIILHPAVNYRYQRSGKGFGWCAANGPTDECKLDPCPLPVKYHELTEVVSIECDEKAWSKLL